MADSTRVLIIEDEAIIAMGLEQMLIRMGYTPVGIVSRSAEVMAEVRQAKPDVVLMDIRLDGTEDGVSLAEEVYVCEGIAVVFVTAFSDARIVERMRMSGAYGCVTKPVDEDRLNAVLAIGAAKHREVLALRRMTRRPGEPPPED